MLKRMWIGNLTIEDRKRLNSRVIGYNGLQLPSNTEGAFSKRKFQNWKNAQKYDNTLISVFVVILYLCHRRYGASLGGTLCFINNPTLRLLSYLSTYDE